MVDGQDTVKTAANTTVTTTATVKTATDLAVEQLTARLDALEKQNAELIDANKGLWAKLHPTEPQTIVKAEPPVQSEPPSDKALDVFNETIFGGSK